MMHGSAIDLCVYLGVLLVYSLIGGVLLKASCLLFNKMADEASVPRPPIERAACLVFFSVFVTGVLSFILVRICRVAGQTMKNEALFDWPILLVFPLGILVLAGANTALLPTTFGKGLLVALLFVLFSSILVGAVLAVALLFGLTMPHLG